MTNDEIYTDLIGQQEEEEEEEEIGRRKEGYRKRKQALKDVVKKFKEHNISYSMVDSISFFLAGDNSLDAIDVVIGIDDLNELCKSMQELAAVLQIAYYKNGDLFKSFYMSYSYAGFTIDVVIWSHSDENFSKVAEKYLVKDRYAKDILLPIIPTEVIFVWYLIAEEHQKELSSKRIKVECNLDFIGVSYDDVFRTLLKKVKMSDNAKHMIELYLD